MPSFDSPALSLLSVPDDVSDPSPPGVSSEPVDSSDVVVSSELTGSSDTVESVLVVSPDTSVDDEVAG